MKKKDEIKFWRKARKLLIDSYGINCKTNDLDDFPNVYKKPKDVFLKQRCASCRTKEIIAYIDDHIELLQL